MAGILLMASFFLMYGAATGLEAVFEGNHGLGWIATGGLFLLVSLLFFKIHFSKSEKMQPEVLKMNNIDFVKIGSWVKEWAQKHPLQSTGAAAVTGFVLAGNEKHMLAALLKELLGTETRE